jgi:hypothetical protein
VADKTRPEIVGGFLTSEYKDKKFRAVTISVSALKKLQAHRKAQQQHREPFGDTCQGDYISESRRLAAEAG